MEKTDRNQARQELMGARNHDRIIARLGPECHANSVDRKRKIEAYKALRMQQMKSIGQSIENAGSLNKRLGVNTTSAEPYASASVYGPISPRSTGRHWESLQPTGADINKHIVESEAKGLQWHGMDRMTNFPNLKEQKYASGICRRRGSKFKRNKVANVAVSNQQNRTTSTRDTKHVWIAEDPVG
jgi:hypothetical protein